MKQEDIHEIENLCFQVFNGIPFTYFAKWVDKYSKNAILEALRETEGNKSTNPNFTDAILGGDNERVRKTRQTSRGKSQGRRGKMLT